MPCAPEGGLTLGELVHRLAWLIKQLTQRSPCVMALCQVFPIHIPIESSSRHLVEVTVSGLGTLSNPVRAAG